jgi:hypothetical protein
VKYLKVKGNEELVRDTGSSAILNTDNDALNAYKARKAKETAMDQIIKEYPSMKSDVAEIKNLLKQLLRQN